MCRSSCCAACKKGSCGRGGALAPSGGVCASSPRRAASEDIVALAQYFTGRLARRYGRQIRLNGSALEVLLNHTFPGNVRELENVLESAAALSLDDPQTISGAD